MTSAPDLVNRDFTAPGPNRLWVADATHIVCGNGVVWMAAVRDVYCHLDRRCQQAPPPSNDTLEITKYGALRIDIC